MAQADIRVKVANPDTARREILSAALDSAKLLQDFSVPVKLNSQKQVLRKKFAKNLKEIKSLARQFESSLPELTSEFKGKEARMPPPKAKTSSKSKPTSLQQELDEIERKIRELGLCPKSR